MSEPFFIRKAKTKGVPIIVSVPHCGIEFPSELKYQFIDTKRLSPDDTDWFVHNLYEFVEDMGITMIHAKYSRWVIDLNRDPESKPLYNDGRIITGLTPHTDFFGENIYLNDSYLPNEDEVQRRLQSYFWPYYHKVKELIDEKIDLHGKVILWDAHSIRRHVPTINPVPFPDMILGDNDETSAHPDIIASALEGLNSGNYQVNHNAPFKGGNITRSFGNPNHGIHALQLEMNKVLYMDDEELNYSTTRSKQIRKVLKQTFENLIDTVNRI